MNHDSTNEPTAPLGEAEAVEPPLGWEFAEPGIGGYPSLAEPLFFTPHGSEQFDAAAAALVRATQVVSTESGSPIDARFYREPGEDEYVLSEFLVIETYPNPGKERGTILVTSEHLDADDLRSLEAAEWDQIEPRNWCKTWDPDADPGDIAIESTRLARQLFDPEGDVTRTFGATVLSIDEDAQTCDVIAEACGAVARRAIATSLGKTHANLDELEQACDELGLSVTAVFTDIFDV